jgi:hypothetical protein
MQLCGFGQQNIAVLSDRPVIFFFLPRPQLHQRDKFNVVVQFDFNVRGEGLSRFQAKVKWPG